MGTKEEFMMSFIANNKEFEIVAEIDCFCEKHGSYKNIQLRHNLPDGTQEDLPLVGCDKCRDENYQDLIQQEHEAIVHNKNVEESQIPLKYKDCTLKDFSVYDEDPLLAKEKATARDDCVKFIRNEIQSIVLLGATNVGKTHLVTAMLKGIIKTGRKALYVVERKIYRDIHESYLGRYDLPTEGQVIDKYSRVEVLGIDEIGRSSWTEHEAQILYEIIDNRDSNNKKTILAGNLNPDEYIAKFDESFRRKVSDKEIVCKWNKWKNN